MPDSIKVIMVIGAIACIAAYLMVKLVIDVVAKKRSDRRDAERSTKLVNFVIDRNVNRFLHDGTWTSVPPGVGWLKSKATELIENWSANYRLVDVSVSSTPNADSVTLLCMWDGKVMTDRAELSIGFSGIDDDYDTVVMSRNLV
jgi:hypothetical protein